MLSTDNTINHPNRVTEIDLLKADLSTHITVLPVTKESYDLIGIHDPNTLYIIVDSAKGEQYLGDAIIPEKRNNNQYLLALGDHRKSFIIYLNSVIEYHDCLVPVAEFDNVNDAIEALYQYKEIGTHTNLGRVIYEILGCYMDDTYGINEAIINIIAASGFRDDIRLQYLNEKAISYGVDNKDKQLPQYYVAALHNLKDNERDTAITIYSDIYDVFVKYNFMKDIKGDDMKDIVYDITNAIHAYLFA